jgi:excisionase family DNA binding protein
MPKTSDLAGNKKRPEWLSPAQLARLQGCSERTIREWCKKGLIPEAYQTRGGHWRIRMPLSGKTILKLEKRRRDWPFEEGGGDLQGNWEPELAESLLLAQLYQRSVDEGIPVPAIAELGDLLHQGLIEEEPADENERRARRIQDEIVRRLETRKPFWDLLVKGWVYQFWLRNQRLPIVEEVAELMGLSRPALYYRGYNAKRLAEDYLTATGELKRELLGPDGLDATQRANLRARKRGFGSIDRDPSADD